MKTLVPRDLGRDHLPVGCVHRLALSGAPLYDRSGEIRKIVNQARTGGIGILSLIFAVAKGD